MKNTKNLAKRSLALFLALVMCFSLLNLTAFAEEGVYVLTCDKEEHTHDDGCYGEARNLICEVPESEDSTEVVEKEIEIFDTVTEPVLDEEGNETGEVVTKQVPTGEYEVSYEVVRVPGHTHSESCYEVESEPVCGKEAHTHSDACYTKSDPEREIGKDAEGNPTVTPPASFTTYLEVKDDEGNVSLVEALVTVTVGEDGSLSATVTVEGKTYDATVTATVTEKGTVTTPVEAVTTEETSSEKVEDGDNVTVTTEYKTTYTTETTTGYEVTYTVSYTVPYTFEIASKSDNVENGYVEVTQDESGRVTSVTVKDGATVKVNGEKVQVTVEDGLYYVTINGKKCQIGYTVVYPEDGYGTCTLTWTIVSVEGAEKNADGKWEYTVENTTELDDSAVVRNADGTVSLKDTVVVNGLTFTKVNGGWTVNVPNASDVSVELIGDATSGYSVKYSYTVSTTTDTRVKKEIPENATVRVTGSGADAKIEIVDADDNVLIKKSVSEFSSQFTGTIQSVSADGTVTTKDANGNIYIYVIKATTNDGSTYSITYEESARVEKTDMGKADEGAQKALDELGKIDGKYYEFIAIALPDGSYKEVGKGSSHTWLVGGDATDVYVTWSGNTITIHYNNGKDQTASYTFDNLEGLNITNVIYDYTSHENPKDGRYDYIIVKIAGIVVVDESTGVTSTVELTVDESGNLTTVTETFDGSADVGGKTTTTNESIDAVLDHEDVVTVTRSGGQPEQMTYREYLEAKEKGEDIELTGVANSSLEVVKEATSTPANGKTYALGEKITYSITVTNTGDLTLKDIAVDDALTGLHETVASLAPGATATFETSHVVTPEDIAAGHVVNYATAQSGDVVGVAEETVETVDADSQLTVTKTVTSTPANGETYALGEEITYSITVENTGNVTVKDITVTDELTNDEWTIESLAPGAEQTFTTKAYTVTEADILAGQVRNVATAQGADDDPEDGEKTVETDPANPQLTVVKTTDFQGAAAAGDKIDYTIVVTNTGNVTVKDITVKDLLPRTTLYKDGNPVPGSATFELAPGESMEFTVSYLVTQADVDKGEDIVNVATAKGTDPNGDETEGTGEAEPVPVVKDGPHLSVYKRASKPADGEAFKLGETITYTITVVNDGNVTLSGIVVTDPLTGLDKSIGKLAPKESTIVLTYYTVTEEDVINGKVINVATAIIGGEDKYPSDEVVTETEEADPSMDVTKTVTSEIPEGQDGYRPGDTITFDIKVVNDGNLTLKDVVVTDRKAGAKIVAGEGYTVNENGTATIAELAPKASVTVKAEYVVTEDDAAEGSVVNSATASAQDPSDPEKEVEGEDETDPEPTEYEPITYTLVYDANGGDEDSVPDSVNYTETEGAKEHLFSVSGTATRDGYRFVGWALSADSTELVDEATAYDGKDSNTVTVYAVWEREPEQPQPEQPEPEQPEEPDIEIPDEEPPLTDLPDEEPPLTDLPDEEPPLTDLPDEEPPLTDLPDEEPPLTDLPDEDPPKAGTPSDNVTIEDEDVPLADIPKTGDESAVWFYLTFLSAASLLCLLVVELKKLKKN